MIAATSLAGRCARPRCGAARSRRWAVAGREQRPEQEAEPVDVGLGGDGLAARLLGRHVARRTLDAPERRVGRAPQDLAHAEAGEPHLPLDGDEHALGAQVPVDNRRRVALLVLGGVRVGEGAGDARADVEDGGVAELLVLVVEALREARRASCPPRARAPGRACPGARRSRRRGPPRGGSSSRRWPPRARAARRRRRPRPRCRA